MLARIRILTFDELRALGSAPVIVVCTPVAGPQGTWADAKHPEPAQHPALLELWDESKGGYFAVPIIGVPT